MYSLLFSLGFSTEKGRVHLTGKVFVYGCHSNDQKIGLRTACLSHSVPEPFKTMPLPNGQETLVHETDLLLPLLEPLDKCRKRMLVGVGHGMDMVEAEAFVSWQ